MFKADADLAKLQSTSWLTQGDEALQLLKNEAKFQASFGSTFFKIVSLGVFSFVQILAGTDMSCKLRFLKGLLYKV